MTAIALQHKSFVLDSIARGRFLKDIALDLGISKQNISRPLVNDPEYQTALKSQAQCLIDEAMSETWSARKRDDILRARGMIDAAFRYGEAIDNQTWGRKSQVTIEVGPDLAEVLREGRDRLRSLRSRTIDADAQRIVSEDQTLERNGTLCQTSDSTALLPISDKKD